MHLVIVLYFLIFNLASASKNTEEENSALPLNKIKIYNESQINIQELLQNGKIQFNREVDDSTFCETCVKVVDLLISHRKTGANKESMITYLNKLCTLYLNTVEPPEVCRGLINIEIDTILYILDNKKDLTPEWVCYIRFQARKCQDPNASNWSIEITPPNANINVQKKIDQIQSEEVKILHLTDFHYDPLYKPGSNADCGVPLCCQEENGPPVDPKNAAGHWGDYHFCDTPWHAITDFSNYVTNKHKKIDLVYYTGDIISHKSWATSKDRNTQAIKDLYNLFKTTFKNTPFYPILGNHEPHPSDFYSPGNVTNPRITTQWIFDLAAEQWERWLPADTKATILKGGYYTVLLRPGIRIIALNSNVCFTFNLWLIYDDVDPYDQLKWLNNVLTEAEKNGERVHILSHIPPGEVDCANTWSIQFKRLVERFAKTISAQFNGHTHFDELRLFRDSSATKKVINVAFNAGSFTTFVGLNPNYRLYSVDSNSFKVMDYDHYTFNITKANQKPDKSPEWYKLYSLKEAYGLKSTSFDDFADLIKRMSSNETLIKQYFRFKVRESETFMKNGCNSTCLQQHLCGITAIDAQEAIICNVPLR